MKKTFYLVIVLILCKISTAQTWVPLGSGINGNVGSLASYNGELYAGGGAFTMAGDIPASRIAKWNGTTWSAVGTGVNGGTGGELVVYNGELYAGGNFTEAGGIAANNIAKWNGTSWSPVGTGTNGGVMGSAVYNGELYISGAFSTAGGIPANRVAKWNGTTWSAVGTGMNNTVNALIVFNGELYAGGFFTTAGDIPANRVAKWNGTSWSAVGTGFNNFISALAVYNGELYAGGIFTTAEGNPASRIAKWNGTQWSAVGSGVGPNSVRNLMVYDGELIVVGGITSAGGVPVNNIAKWNGTAWSAMGLGLNAQVIGLAEYNGDLHVSGDFIRSGSVEVSHVARWVPPCFITTSAGADENLIVGYGPIQCKTKTAVVSNGTAPFTHSWTLDRALLPGETISGANTASATACLIETAQLCVTVTDARNCTASDCATFSVKDVRCFAGNNQKIQVCHKGNTICIDESAVPAHLAHGDYLGTCTETLSRSIQNLTSEENSNSVFTIYPNPNKGSFTVVMDLPNDPKIIRVLNMSGQVVREIRAVQNQVSMNINKQGIYLVQIISNKKTFNKRLVIAAH